MVKTAYKPVPVAEAVRIADQFDKLCVVILAYDQAHGLTHCTSYGKSAEAKQWAAGVGELCMATIAGPEALSQSTCHEDFRTVDAAKRAQAIDQLVRAAESADRALGAVIADRFGIPADSLQVVRDCLHNAIKQGKES